MLSNRTVVLCFLAALLEGADIVSMGLAAPLVAKVFGFDVRTLSFILTSTIVGLMIGAAIGGRLGDRMGRKKVLVGAFSTLALCSLLTTQAYDLGSFILIRLLCGLGLGAAFPNLIAITAEAALPHRRSTSIGLMFAGQPLGATLLALYVAAQDGAMAWQAIFLIGGLLPLLLLPLLIIALPESSVFRAARSRGVVAPDLPLLGALFGQGRAPVTLFLWACYAGTQVIVYLLNNWLPTLMVAKGFSPQQAGMISALENAGAALGCVFLGIYADRGNLRSLILGIYGITALSLSLLSTATQLPAVLVIGIVLGFFAVGGQFVLYGLAPGLYPVLCRSSGVGAAVAVGRLGAIGGPLGAGALLAAGFTPAAVLLAAVPIALAAGASALALIGTVPGRSLTSSGDREDLIHGPR